MSPASDLMGRVHAPPTLEPGGNEKLTEESPASVAPTCQFRARRAPAGTSTCCCVEPSIAAQSAAPADTSEENSAVVGLCTQTLILRVSCALGCRAGGSRIVG